MNDFKKGIKGTLEGLTWCFELYPFKGIKGYIPAKKSLHPVL
jgi:hypothetical protein